MCGVEAAPAHEETASQPSTKDYNGCPQDSLADLTTLPAPHLFNACCFAFSARLTSSIPATLYLQHTSLLQCMLLCIFSTLHLFNTCCFACPARLTSSMPATFSTHPTSSMPATSHLQHASPP
eukprot:scaffold38733_cov20-Tisochrysis_lutea.AAC.1